MPGLATIDCRKAIAAGLQFRPVRETVADTLSWRRARPTVETLKAGLSREREAKVLAAWHEQTEGSND
jgi:2'-hydroxyisoflavone reductase